MSRRRKEQTSRTELGVSRELLDLLPLKDAEEMNLLLQTQCGVGIQRSGQLWNFKGSNTVVWKASSKWIEGFQMVQCWGNWSVLSGGNFSQPGGPSGYLPGPQKEPKLPSSQAASVLYCFIIQHGCPAEN